MLGKPVGAANTAVLCQVQVTPPSVVFKILPPPPTVLNIATHAVLASNAMMEEGPVPVALVTGCTLHVVPPSIVLIISCKGLVWPARSAESPQHTLESTASTNCTQLFPLYPKDKRSCCAHVPVICAGEMIGNPA